MYEQHSYSEDYVNPYKFNGKELDVETNLYYYGARYYDPSTSLWLSVDPAYEMYPSFSPYAYTMQNPVRYTDPTGMVVEGSEWIPNVDDDGNVTYIVEEGDNAFTLASQYGLDQDVADNLYSTMENGEISGENVGKVRGGNQVLRLDLTSPEGRNEQRRFDQHLFASDISKAYGEDSYHPADFFSNRLEGSTSMWGGYGDISGTATLNVDGQSLELDYSLSVYNSNKYTDRNAFKISAFSSYRKPTTGQRFSGNTGLLNVYRILPNGKAVEENFFTIKDSKRDLYLKRLNRKFSTNKGATTFKN